MKTPFIGIFALCAAAFTPIAHAAVVYSHTFDGSSSTALTGTLVDGSSQAWVANAAFKADGTGGTSQGSAWIPYAFGTGVYTLTANIDVSGAGATAFTLISFTNFNPANFSTITGDLSGHSSSYASFGQRGAGDWDFWGGTAANNSVDGSTAGTFPKVNTLKLVLDTTQTKWTVTASLLNASSVEVFADLNGVSPGVAYTFATNPASFTGVGFFLRSGDAIDSLTLSVASVPEPSTYAALAGVTVIGLCVLHRRRQR